MDSESVTSCLKEATLASETVYELPRDVGGRLDSPTSHVVSERVQNLASQIYNELKKIINRCGEDEEVVGGLMPLIVNVLEALDLAIIENQQLQVELELCKDDNEQLVNAFDKEKLNKKKIEAKLFEYEFQSDEEKQEFQQKIESLESIVKILELKSKNSSDHASRLEEKESEIKTEYNKLHTRFNELLRAHCDLMERMKILMGNDNSTFVPGNISSSSNNNLRALLNKRNELESPSNAESPSEVVQKSGANSPSITKQAWEKDLSLEDASIIEDVEEIPRDKEPVSTFAGNNANQTDYPTSVADNFFVGMEKEVENLILENNELLATKNALNIVKDDLIAKVDELQSELTMAKDETQQLTAVKNKLKSRIQSLEEEIKKCTEELEEAKLKIAQLSQDGEEDIPMAQRKRFTRVEMARVLMERNQYKERLIELQDAMRLTEIIRQSKNEGEKKSAIWKFFSNFFSTSSSTSTSTKGSPSKHANSGSSNVRYSAPNMTTTLPALEAMRKRARAQHFGGSTNIIPLNEDLSEGHLKNVKAHVSRVDGGRIHAYGWSINANQDENQNANKLKTMSVPVPIYCRPLTGDDIGMKIWCAAAVDLSGAAGFITSSDIESRTVPKSTSEIAIADLELELNKALAEQNDAANETKLSTFIWICSVSHSRSKVTIVNIRSNPSEVLDSFIVKTHLLCVASIPGYRANDFQGNDSVDLKSKEIRLMKSEPPKTKGEEVKEESNVKQEASESVEQTSLSADASASNPSSPVHHSMATCLPTMWLGGQNSVLYVHSSIAQWSHCIASVKLPDSILQIIQFRGRVFVALANGQLCVFTRCTKTGEWDFVNYISIDVGSVSLTDVSGKAPGSSVATYSVRCIEIAKASIWLGYRNLIVIVDPSTLRIVDNFPVNQRKETQVRLLAAMGDGVWCSMRLESLLKLYSSTKPYNHLQDLDIEPCISKVLSPKAFSFIRITSLKTSGARLWIGTANGIILSIPCDKSNLAKDTQTVLASNESGKIEVKTFIPKCNEFSAQVSFHGHKDAVKFFVCTKSLIMSGGEGYVDCRVNTDDCSTKGDQSHLIVWEIAI